ncbi:MAG TPA: ankyrin repeat domain-containing protein [Steroidobacteraceae bacterium]|nr:ankyrin repeat domain-containing protein [Steroidobacteraceae bacterium]
MSPRAVLIAWVTSALLYLAVATAAADPLLADAIKAGDRQSALEMLKTGADVNAAQPDGSTPLHWAVYRDDIDLVRALLERGAKANVVNLLGSTPLAEAVKVSNLDLVALLLKAGANVDTANADGETPLMLAARNGSLPIAQQLVRHGANVNAREQWRGQTALMWAAAERYSDVVELLIAHHAQVNVHAVANDWGNQITNEPRAQYRPTGGLTPLLYAARSGCLPCVQAMLKAGADINMPNPDGVTPLMVAIDNLHFDLAKYLLDRRANPHTWDWWGRTPLYFAVDMHSYPNSRGAFGGPRVQVHITDKTTAMDLIKVLLAAGVNPNPQLDMHRPGRGGNSARFVENLLNAGATPLLRAAIAQDPEACQVLLDHGALVDLPNAMGVTPLMAAAGIGISTVDPRPLWDGDMQGRALATLEVLVKAGADVNARIADTQSHTARIARPSSVTDRQGQTALYGPINWGWTRVAQFLLDHGARVDVADAKGVTPLDALKGDVAGRDKKSVEQLAALIKNAGAPKQTEVSRAATPTG